MKEHWTRTVQFRKLMQQMTLNGASFTFEDDSLTGKVLEFIGKQQGMSASGARYSDGIYVFWSKGDSATVYKRDRIVLNNCQLENPKR